MSGADRKHSLRHMVVILGDQLDANSSALDGFEPARDRVWMAEVSGESTHVWSAKHRIVLFLSAMRQYAAGLEGRGYAVSYRAMDKASGESSLGTALAADLEHHGPARVVMTRPGDYRVLKEIEGVCISMGIPLELREDTHFYCDLGFFTRYARSRKQLRMEYFYREMRRRTGVLMEDGQPIGGSWNFDASNRESFGRGGPERGYERMRFTPNSVTRELMELVENRFPEHPGSLEGFDWPTNREQALEALRHFITEELPHFGTHQDAMWTDQPFLSHSLLASSLNLKLLNPREVVAAAEDAYYKGQAPIESVEGFIRQILGWREYVRGIYWTYMPGYLDLNALNAREPLPAFYWTGDTEMNCLRQVIGQTLKHGYAHHIQRLMVTGLYALLLGVDPKAVHEWYLAVYVDAVEWVELPNTLGMSQYADGGLMASKPYAATGKYINRMSNYCRGCRFDPDKRTGEGACPFTTLYWDFLSRNQDILRNNPRMRMQLKNLARIPENELDEIRAAADRLKQASMRRQSTRPGSNRPPRSPKWRTG